MKIDQLITDLLSLEITKYLDTKDVINLKKTSKLFNNLIKDDNPGFKIINISDKNTDEIIKSIENDQNKLDFENNTYIICVLKDQLFYAYIPDNLKLKFINSKMLIMNGS